MSGCGLSTSWNFPDTTECPNRSCRRRFENRLETLEHFRDYHAKDAILCFLCDKPVSSPTSRCFIRHYRRIHPNEKVPYDFGEPEKNPSPKVCWAQMFKTFILLLLIDHK